MGAFGDLSESGLKDLMIFSRMMGLGGSGEAATWIGCTIGSSYYGREVLMELARGRCQEFGIPFQVVGARNVASPSVGTGLKPASTWRLNCNAIWECEEGTG